MKNGIEKELILDDNTKVLSWELLFDKLGEDVGNINELVVPEGIEKIGMDIVLRSLQKITLPKGFKSFELEIGEGFNDDGVPRVFTKSKQSRLKEVAYQGHTFKTKEIIEITLMINETLYAQATDAIVFIDSEKAKAYPVAELAKQAKRQSAGLFLESNWQSLGPHNFANFLKWAEVKNESQAYVNSYIPSDAVFFAIEPTKDRIQRFYRFQKELSALINRNKRYLTFVSTSSEAYGGSELAKEYVAREIKWRTDEAIGSFVKLYNALGGFENNKETRERAARLTEEALKFYGTEKFEEFFNKIRRSTIYFKGAVDLFEQNFKDEKSAPDLARFLDEYKSIRAYYSRQCTKLNKIIRELEGIREEARTLEKPDIDKQLDEAREVRKKLVFDMDFVKTYINTHKFKTREGCEELFREVEKYLQDYTQESFDRMQDCFEKAQELERKARAEGKRIKIFADVIDEKTKGFTYAWANDITNPISYTCGNATDCCYHFGGDGEAALEEAILSPDVTTLLIYDEKKELIASAMTVISVEKGEILFDNIEVKKGYGKYNTQILENVLRATGEQIAALEKEGIMIDRVAIGSDHKEDLPMVKGLPRLLGKKLATRVYIGHIKGAAYLGDATKKQRLLWQRGKNIVSKIERQRGIGQNRL